MAEEEQQESKFTPLVMAVAVVGSGAFFAFMTYMLRPFVFAETPWKVWAGAAFTAIPLTGVFFFASTMFLILLKDAKNHRV